MRCYLLILSCSQRKRRGPGLLPAIERYDGVSFRVIRKAMREGRWNENIDVLILSAKHGFLKVDDKIEDYDEEITKERANELKGPVLAALQECLRQRSYADIFVNMGKGYLAALPEWHRLLSGTDTRVIYPEGGIGKKLSSMKEWIDSLE